MERITDWNKVPVLVDVGYVCNIFAVSRQTVRNWTSKGILNARNIGGSIRYAKEDLMNLGVKI